jgi:hypothetical protein
MLSFAVFLQALAKGLGYAIKNNGNRHNGQTIHHAERQILV